MREAKLYTDGGARGNPGPAGIGFVLLDSDDNSLAEEGRYIGEATNNVAEYRALLLGLEWALAMGIDKLSVYADSELMVRQLKGEYKVKNDGLIPLYQEAMRSARRFSSISFTHIPRAKNRRADKLVNRAVDE
ncbi:MAG: ribonuclease HI family protein, partial [bacterium]|nr:ribonuclease HI family protein [bacterium]